MRDVRVRRRIFGRRVMPDRKFVGVGMTGKARRVMPKREFVGVGMTGKVRWVMPEREFVGKA